MLRHWLLCLLDRAKKFGIGGGAGAKLGSARIAGIVQGSMQTAARTHPCPPPAAGERMTRALARLDPLRHLFAGAPLDIGQDRRGEQTAELLCWVFGRLATDAQLWEVLQGVDEVRGLLRWPAHLRIALPGCCTAACAILTLG